MPIAVSLAALQRGDVRLTGEISPDELGLETLDPCVRAERPVNFDVGIELMGHELFISGEVSTVYDCVCVRCLTPFEWPARLAPWTCLVPLQGEEAVRVEGEMVDLTPQLREDMLLALPQHPVCRPDCAGFSAGKAGLAPSGDSAAGPGQNPSAWSILDKLKLD
jgi:uncharacterized protein